MYRTMTWALPSVGKPNPSYLPGYHDGWLIVLGIGPWHALNTKKRYPFGPPREVHSLEKSKIKLCPRVPAYQLENQWCKSWEMLAIINIHTASRIHEKQNSCPPAPQPMNFGRIYPRVSRCQNLYPVPQPPPKQSECRIRRPVFFLRVCCLSDFLQI